MTITDFFKEAALFGAEWVMYLLVALSVLSISIIVERVLIFVRIHGRFAEFLSELQERMVEGESAARISRWCGKNRLLEARLAEKLLSQQRLGSADAISDYAQTLITTSRIRLERGLTILGTLGNNTPFVGLLGTIIGIINAFHALAVSESSNPRVVMSSISEALVATAVGILVAIPAVAAYNVFSRTIRRKVANCQAVANLISSHINILGTAEAAAGTESQEV